MPLSATVDTLRHLVHDENQGYPGSDQEQLLQRGGDMGSPMQGGDEIRDRYIDEAGSGQGEDIR